MITVRRGNVVLKNINEADAQHYLNQGYDVVDENGFVIKQALPQEEGKLRAMYIEQTKKVETLENTIKALTEEISELKKQLNAKSTKAESKPEPEKAPEEPSVVEDAVEEKAEKEPKKSSGKKSDK